MQHTLGAVEKISIRRKAQDMMLQYGIIDWICSVLRDSHKLKEYTLEYVTALLMNLALRTEGKRRCEACKSELLKILKSLLDKENAQIRTHINGTLYSLFTSVPIKLEARVLFCCYHLQQKMGFVDHLERRLDTDDENMARQITYMLSQLEADSSEACPSDEEDAAGDESEEDISYYAEEGDDISPGGRGTMAAGEELLLSEFLATTEEALQQSKTISQQLAGNGPEEVVEERKDRPVTPINGLPDNRPSIDSRIPSAMRARPKIPRTPIPMEKLEQAKRENEELYKNAMHIHKNEFANKKKQLNKHGNDRVDEGQKMGMHSSKEEEPLPHPIITEATRQKVIRSEAKNREERKWAREVKKDMHHGVLKRKDMDQLTNVSLNQVNCRNI
eukprot:TRINITY_DN135286_c0_g1_i1.p2 TRINITY_DN135286_c0_g1~~TRINITY_DN135286_c0_g1_i1.p2  ORF type:complete len:389 (+),score=50.21 TRINITY_DN135286_c0_g1_i1:2241-3407(+)